MTELRTSTAWHEDIRADEDAQFEAAAQRIVALQQRYASKNGGTRRAFHVKAHAGLRAELRVLDDVPEVLRYGLFAEPKSYAASARFSNGFPGPQLDWLPDVRGFAVRVHGVEGPRLLGEQGETGEQDLIGLNVPYIPFRDATDFAVISTASTINPLTAPLKIVRQMGLAGGVKVLLWGLRTLRPVHSLATESFWSNLPMTVGPYAVKYKWAPQQPRRRRWKPIVGRNYFRRELAKRLRNEDVRFDLMVQCYVDEERTPIELGAHEWKGAPFVRVAELTIPKQDVESDEARERERALDATAFNPWNGIEAHRPLGNTQRARLVVYKASSSRRQSADGTAGAEERG